MFRYRSYKYRVPFLGEVYEDSVKTVVKDGVTLYSVVKVRAVDNVSIPHPDSYKLSDLLQAGISLTPIDSRIIDNAPSSDDFSKLDSFLNKEKENEDNNDNNDTDSAVTEID